MAKWQVAHWTKMSRQRKVAEYGPLYQQNQERNDSLMQNGNKEMGTSIRTLKDDHEEDLNPLTKNWRESLRGFHFRFMLAPVPSPVKKKKKVTWSKKKKIN